METVGHHAGSRPAVLVLAKGFPPTPGGVETYSDEVAKAYLRAGFRVFVLTQREGRRGWATHSTDDGTLRAWNAGSGNQIVTARRLWRQVLAMRSEHEIVGVHSTTWRVALLAQAAFRDVPRVVTVHGREVLNYPLGTGVLMRATLRDASTVITVSGETLRMASAAAGAAVDSRWVVSHNGLTDVRRASNARRDARPGKVRVLSLCRLVPRKNVAHLVEAVALLSSEEREQLEVRVAGRGPEASRIEELIDRHALSDSVRLLGYVPDDDVPDLYAWADVFVHPHSHVGEGLDFEGFGIAIADAMAYGCAVVSGRAGGPLDFVRDGETGLLVDGDDPASIADAIRLLLRDPDHRRVVAVRGRAHALRSFSWDRHIIPAINAIHARGAARCP